MCFSAAGSFSVAAVIAGIGVLGAAQKKPPTHRMLAAVPLMFAAQQVAEGVVWSTLGDPSRRTENLVAVAAFLAFALVIWPAWVPLALMRAERDPGRRRILASIAWFGAAVAGYAAALLLQHTPTADVAGHRLAYSYAQSNRPWVVALYLPGYVLPVLVPFFVSTINRAKLMGVVLAVALVVTFIAQRQALTSVWCFFAAILSAVIVLSINRDGRLVASPA